MNGRVFPRPGAARRSREAVQGRPQYPRHTESESQVSLVHIRSVWKWRVRRMTGVKGAVEQFQCSIHCKSLIPRAPVPYPQVRWLDPPGTHPNHLRNGGGPGALGLTHFGTVRRGGPHTAGPASGFWHLRSVPRGLGGGSRVRVTECIKNVGHQATNQAGSHGNHFTTAGASTTVKSSATCRLMSVTAGLAVIK